MYNLTRPVVAGLFEEKLDISKDKLEIDVKDLIKKYFNSKKKRIIF